SNMSHDIRTPMNAIVGFTALAITHIEHTERVEEYLKKIMSSGNHLLSLINDILDMSRIESGKMRLDENPCRLPEILHGLRNIVQADVHSKQLELFIDTVDVLDEDIYCDKLRLNQVLLNLLSNAVKYTGAGGTVSIRITEKAGAAPGYANYEFCIRDTGIGMSEEFVAHIFEPFEREKNTTTSGIQGTGLGMAITKNIVDMMNGSIEVKSRQGEGTEVSVSFTFRLHSMEKEPQEIPELWNCRALVVDDDFNSCDSVTYMLGQVGMRAEWTLSGKEAVLRTRQAVSRGDNYSVYVIDWLLPDMNGVEVTRRIRKEVGDDAPVIVLTAYDWADIEDEAKEAGVTAFCSKPLFLSELRSCLHSIIDSKNPGSKKENETKMKFEAGRILLAEDNELNQEIAVEILGDAGFSVDVAGDGKIAVDMLEKSEPGYYQVILMDIQMPVMNGYAATRAIRSV
ncbi:MAG: hybrid sensor histidine kinase/response regulator, partial [Lachnospiraceae bacterium]|nr:hybrid sensor histidine kinase/response regulator [Lachnospiraceae bacterium]